MHTTTLTLALCAGALLLTAAQAAPALPEKLPPHPRLLLNKQGIEQLKERVKRHKWATKRWNAILRGAEADLTKAIELPPRGGNWTHWYACPEHGTVLTKGGQIGPWRWEHSCPVGGEKLASDPSKASTDYDGCIISGIHGEWARSARDLGLVYQVTGDKRCADKAREILLAYAERYASYPLHNVHGEAKVGGGKKGAQTLDEAVWLIPMCQGADFVWDTLSDSDRKTLADKLFLPAVKEVILPHKMGIHNIQCWKNSAVGLAGLLLDDQELIREALYNADRGYAAQIKKGVTPDGGWWEGAWGYHFYTVSALWPLCEAARNCGIDLYGDKLKSMFDAPLKFATPDLRLPAFSDSGEVNLAASSSIYELAYARFKDPRYLQLVSLKDRVGDYSLWFGEPDLPAAPPREWKSENYPKTGVAVLARGQGEGATWLCCKYGPYGGGHGHPDKLSFVLYSKKQALGIDPGLARYGAPIHQGWYRQTIAHNTLVVDETSQKAVDGELIEFSSAGGADFIAADAGPIYDGVRFTRKIEMRDEKHIVITDHITCDTERTLDIAYHQRGAWEKLPEGTPWTPPDKPGYKYMKDATTRSTGKGISLTVKALEVGPVSITLEAGDPTEVITTTGVGAHVNDRVPMVIFRRKAKETTFVWSITRAG